MRKRAAAVVVTVGSLLKRRSSRGVGWKSFRSPLSLSLAKCSSSQRAVVDYWHAATAAAMGSDMPARPRTEAEAAKDELAGEATGVKAELGRTRAGKLSRWRSSALWPACLSTRSSGGGRARGRRRALAAARARVAWLRARVETRGMAVLLQSHHRRSSSAARSDGVHHVLEIRNGTDRSKHRFTEIIYNFSLQTAHSAPLYMS